MGQEQEEEDDKRDEDTQPFAREEELRREQEHEPLSGCDFEHCQRMHE
jgi:hypothetical protein